MLKRRQKLLLILGFLLAAFAVGCLIPVLLQR